MKSELNSSNRMKLSVDKNEVSSNNRDSIKLNETSASCSTAFDLEGISPLESNDLGMSNKKKCSNTILKQIGLGRKRHLTPNCKKLYCEAMKLKRKFDRLEVFNKKTKCQLNLAKKFSKSPLIDQLVNKVNSSTFNFILSQMKMQKIKSQGRRYSLDDKIMALSMFQTSPKAYKFLSTLFELPSEKSLTNLLQRVPYHAGVNDHIINNLKYQSEKLNFNDKCCSLLFDEMALSASLFYDKKADLIYGFESFVTNTPKFADHVLLFMLKGIRKKFIQPIAYYYCQGTTKTEHLIHYIKEVITAVQSTGLKIKAIVCDQGCTNQAAINFLINERIRFCQNQNMEDQYNGFLINGEEIIVIFDPPHLLKCVRNNLLTKNLKFKFNGQFQTASWDHIEALYHMDKKNEKYELQTLPKLTEAHVIPSKIKRMKVSAAAQIFSHRVASTMRLIANCESNSILSNASGTANLCLFMDKVFDSVNGSTIKQLDGKPLKCAIKNDSPHIPFWHEAIKVFESMVFVDKSTGFATKQPLCIRNWIKTLKGFEYLWLTLKSESFKFILLRNINQDSLDCFFGSIRSHGIRNNMPNCYHFLTSFKTLLLNNFSSIKSLGNCEQDDSCGVLDNLKQFLTGRCEDREEIPIGLSTFNVEFYTTFSSCISEMTVRYVAGYLAKSILKSINNCKLCKNDCLDANNLNNLISARRYINSSRLKEPSIKLNEIIDHILFIMSESINNLCNKPHVMMKFDLLIYANVDFNFSCTDHNLKQIVTQKAIEFFLFTWCKNVNRVLSGVDTRTDNNILKKMAKQYYVKHKMRKSGYNK